MRIFKAIVAAAVLALLGAWLTGQFSDSMSDADQIRAAIKQVARGAESANIEEAMEPFSAQYEDPEGLDRRGVYGLLWSQFKKRGPISVWMSAMDVEVSEGTATARFDAALMEGAQTGGIGLPVNGDALTFEVELARQDNGWHIVSHNRRPAWELEPPRQ